MVGYYKVVEFVFLGWFMKVDEVECLGFVLCVVFVVEFLVEVEKLVGMIVLKLLLLVYVVKVVLDVVMEMMLFEGFVYEK